MAGFQSTAGFGGFGAPSANGFSPSPMTGFGGTSINTQAAGTGFNALTTPGGFQDLGPVATSAKIGGAFGGATGGGFNITPVSLPPPLTGGIGGGSPLGGGTPSLGGGTLGSGFTKASPLATSGGDPGSAGNSPATGLFGKSAGNSPATSLFGKSAFGSTSPAKSAFGSTSPGKSAFGSTSPGKPSTGNFGTSPAPKIDVVKSGPFRGMSKNEAMKKLNETFLRDITNFNKDALPGSADLSSCMRQYLGLACEIRGPDVALPPQSLTPSSSPSKSSISQGFGGIGGGFGGAAGVPTP